MSIFTYDYEYADEDCHQCRHSDSNLLSWLVAKRELARFVTLADLDRERVGAALLGFAIVRDDDRQVMNFD